MQGVTVSVGSQTQTLASRPGPWDARFQLPEDATGTLRVTAKCGNGDVSWSYPATSVKVVKEVGLPGSGW